MKNSLIFCIFSLVFTGCINILPYETEFSCGGKGKILGNCNGARENIKQAYKLAGIEESNANKYDIDYQIKVTSLLSDQSRYSSNSSKKKRYKKRRKKYKKRRKKVCRYVYY